MEYKITRKLEGDSPTVDVAREDMTQSWRILKGKFGDIRVREGVRPPTGTDKGLVLSCCPHDPDELECFIEGLEGGFAHKGGRTAMTTTGSDMVVVGDEVRRFWEHFYLNEYLNRPVGTTSITKSDVHLVKRVRNGLLATTFVDRNDKGRRWRLDVVPLARVVMVAERARPNLKINVRRSMNVAYGKLPPDGLEERVLEFFSPGMSQVDAKVVADELLDLITRIVSETLAREKIEA